MSPARGPLAGEKSGSLTGEMSSIALSDVEGGKREARSKTFGAESNSLGH